MTKFSNGERLRQRLPRGARGGPEGAAGAAAPRRRRAGGRRALQGQSGGGAAPRRRPGGGPGSAGVVVGGGQLRHTRPRDLFGMAGQGSIRPLSPPCPPAAAPRPVGGGGKRAPVGTGAAPALPGRARRSAPAGDALTLRQRRKGFGEGRLGWYGGAHGERRGEPRPGGRGRRGTYSGSRCGLGWAALIQREGRSRPPPRGPGCSAAVRK